MAEKLSISEWRQTIQRNRELGAYGGDMLPPEYHITTEIHTGEITSTTQTSNRYPGTRYDYDANGDSYTASETIWIDTIQSGQILQTGVKYQLKLVGVRASDGIAIYMAMNPPLWMRGKLDGALTSEGSQTMSIWTGSGAGSDSGQDVTIHGSIPGATIPSGTIVGAAFDQKSNLWQVTERRC